MLVIPHEWHYINNVQSLGFHLAEEEITERTEEQRAGQTAPGLSRLARIKKDEPFLTSPPRRRRAGRRNEDASPEEGGP